MPEKNTSRSSTMGSVLRETTAICSPLGRVRRAMAGKLAFGVMPDAGGSAIGSFAGGGGGDGGVADAAFCGWVGGGGGAALQATSEQASKLAKRFTACLL